MTPFNFLSQLSDLTSGCENPPVHHPDLLVESLYNYVCAYEYPTG